MRRRFVRVDGADKFEVWAKSLADQGDDFFGDGGGEHEGLARSFLPRWHERLHFLYGRSKANVKETVRFIENENFDVVQADATVLIRQ